VEFTENITQFDHITEENDKKQILLCHTSRPLKFYLKSINYRLNNQFDRVPHYLISEKGGIIKNYDERKYSNFMLNPNIDKNVIIVCLENLGWLRYKEKEDKYVNWVGDEYNGDIFNKRWRDKTFWSTYSENQINSLSKLLNYLSVEFQIPLNFVGHNVTVDDISDFVGVTCKSNYSQLWTDVSPAFDFEKLKNKTYEIQNI